MTTKYSVVMSCFSKSSYLAPEGLSRDSLEAQTFKTITAGHGF